MANEKSRVDWKVGDAAQVKPNVEGAGETFRVLGPAVFLRQWWVPIEDPDEEDPTFFKESCLDLFEPRGIYVPTSLRTYYEQQITPEPREVKYGIGQLHTSEPNAAIGMWLGPTTSLLEVLEIAGKDNNSVLIKFHTDGTDRIIYRWNTMGHWVEIKPDCPQKIHLET